MGDTFIIGFKEEEGFVLSDDSGMTSSAVEFLFDRDEPLFRFICCFEEIPKLAEDLLYWRFNLRSSIGEISVASLSAVAEFLPVENT